VLINKDLITSFKFAKNSDIVFSGVFLDHQIDELKIKPYEEVQRFGDYKYIRNFNFEIKENDIVFCRIEDLNILFNLLSKINLNNIKIISHQSDLEVNKQLYLKKPNCVSEWFSINVNFKAKNLIPIPIGLANEHPKNLNELDFSSNELDKQLLSPKSKKYLLFVNFQESTNYKKRSGLYEYFEQFDWVNIKKPTLTKSNYLDNLRKSSFTLAPPGNGYDTHRVWEALYSGSIPIVEGHISNSYAENLPVLFVDRLKNVDKKLLIEKQTEIKDSLFDFEKLFFEYWYLLIVKNKITDSKTYIVNQKSLKIKLLEYRYYISFNLSSKMKKARYNFMRILKLIKRILNIN